MVPSYQYCFMTTSLNADTAVHQKVDQSMRMATKLIKIYFKNIQSVCIRCAIGDKNVDTYFLLDTPSVIKEGKDKEKKIF